jgi:hypothetical protein
MSDPAAFLLARYAEEEERAREAGAAQGLDWLDHEGIVVSRTAPVEAPGRFLDMYAPSGTWALWDCEGASSLGVHPATSLHIARHDPARVLADIAAKRRVVELHGRYDGWGDHCRTCRAEDEVGGDAFPCETLRALVQPHADHPDWREEWAL